MNNSYLVSKLEDISELEENTPISIKGELSSYLDTGKDFPRCVTMRLIDYYYGVTCFLFAEDEEELSEIKKKTHGGDALLRGDKFKIFGVVKDARSSKDKRYFLKVVKIDGIEKMNNKKEINNDLTNALLP
jgi:hypothetical protein